MAKVPVYDGRQVGTAALPNARQNIATPDGAFGATQARQLGQVAQASGQLAQAFQQQKLEADRTRVDDALNQLRESELDLTFNKDTGYTALKGVQALQRPNNKSLSDDYYEQYNARLSEIESGLGNDVQRAAFRRNAQARATAFRGNLMNYEGDQFRAYQGSVAEGTVATATTQIAQFYNDPSKIDDGVLSIRAAVANAGRLQGLSATQIESRSAIAVSQAHLGAIDQALATSNPLIAEDYLRKYKSDLTPGDMLKARGKVDEVASKYIAGAKANQVFSDFSSKASPTDMDRVIQITMQTESGGRRYGKDGQLLTSPKGAKGEMQVMDATNLDPGYGVVPAQNDSPDERARVGRDYMAAMIKEYDANLPMAWAAYNAGPGAVNKAVKEAQAAKDPASWLSRLPKETQDYVAKNTKAYASGGGKPATPSLEDLRERMRTDPDLQTRPAAMKLALDEVDRKWSDHQKGVKVNQENAFAEAMQIIEGGGRYTDLPDSLKQQIAPSNWDKLRTYEGKVRGAGVETDLGTYQLLSGNPERIRNMSDAEFYALRNDLSPTDFKKFADMRADKTNAKDNPEALDFQTVKRVVDQRLTALKLDPKRPADAGRMGAIRRHIDDVVLAEQQKIGRKLTDAETIRLVDEQFLRTRAFKESSWFGDDEVRKANVFGTKVGDIPSKERKAIEADLLEQGFDAPTDQQVLEAYFMGDYLRSR